jgi:hypothetical protein
MKTVTLAAALAFVDIHNGAVTAIATIVIAAFTIVLALVTGRQAHLTRIAAEAAKQSAFVAERALTELERPWIFIQGAKLTWRDSQLPGQPRLRNDWYISLKLKNVGRMPAIIYAIVFKIEDKATLPPTPDYRNSGALTCPGTIAPGDEVDTNDVGPGPGRQNELVFYGKITYRELNGKEHHSGFALDIAPFMPAFSRHANDAYDYYD